MAPHLRSLSAGAISSLWLRSLDASYLASAFAQLGYNIMAEIDKTSLYSLFLSPKLTRQCLVNVFILTIK